MNDFLYRLFFTKDDDMDLTQFYFGLAVVFFFVAFALVGAGVWKVPTAAWATLGAVFTTLAIAGTSHVVSTRIAQSKAAGEVAAGIAQSGVTPLDTDDGRDEDQLERGGLRVG